jgi:catalase-peroxidase
MILAGNVAIESMGGPVFGFGGGRADVWEPEKDIYWGTEEEWLGETRIKEEAGHAFENPLAAVQHGLIYVNPEGPGRQARPDRLGPRHPRDLQPDGMNDEETVALIAGGHTFGKAHGAGDASKVGREPEGSDIAAQGFGWANSHGTGLGDDTITSGLEGPWTPTPIKWDDTYFRMLLDYDYELEKSPSGAHQWRPINQGPETMAPGAHSPDRLVPTMMSTADLAIKADPKYRAIAERWRENPEELGDAFARAWFKLCHRDMGPEGPLPRAGSPGRGPDLAGPDPAGRPPAGGLR